jgi:hypothetical protein
LRVFGHRRAGRCPDNAVLISLGMTKQVAQLCDEQLHVGRETRPRNKPCFEEVLLRVFGHRNLASFTRSFSHPCAPLGMTKQVAQLCDEQLHVGRETNQPINGSLWVDKQAML